jgi:hypothetical protein
MRVSQRSKIENDGKLQGEERKQVEKMLNILGARLTFLSERGQSDERQHIPLQEDAMNMDMEVTCIRIRPSDSSSNEALLSSTRRGRESTNLATTSQCVLARQPDADGGAQRLGWTGRVGGLESPPRISKN